MPGSHAVRALVPTMGRVGQRLVRQPSRAAVARPHLGSIAGKVVSALEPADSAFANVPELFDGSSLPGGRLASHQLDALRWLDSRPVALLADPTGSGKTAVAGAVLGRAFEHDGATKGLWVTEAHLVPQTLRELRRFLPGLPCSAWAERREEPLAVVSYDMLARRVDQLIHFAADVIVLDEASALKNAGRRADAARSVVDEAWRRLALTATPMEVDAMETYRLLRLLGANKLPSEDDFARYLRWQQFADGERKAIGVRPEALPMLRAALAPYVLRREVDQLGLRLPGLIEEQVWVGLTPPQEAAYRAAATDWSDLRRAQRRDKACTEAQGRSAKAEAAVAWLSSHPEVGKAVVFAENLEHLTITQRLLVAAGIRWVRIDGGTARGLRADAVDVFRRDPSVRVLLGTRVLEGT